MTDPVTPNATVDTYANRLAQLIAVAAPYEDPTDILRRWNLSSDDEQAKDIARRLAIVWEGWSLEQRLLLLRAADAVATADAARLDWNAQTTEERTRYKQVAHQCATATRLARDLATMFPPPWTGATAPFGELITALIAFTSSGAHETLPMDLNVAVRMAQVSLEELRQNTPQHAGRVSSAFVAELAWLAGGKRSDNPRDERTIRRYLDDDHPPVMPRETATWRRGWPSLRDMFRLARESGRRLDDRFVTAIRDFLRGGRIH